MFFAKLVGLLVTHRMRVLAPALNSDLLVNKVDEIILVRLEVFSPCHLDVLSVVEFGQGYRVLAFAVHELMSL